MNKWKWLESTRELQRESFGFDWDASVSQGTYEDDLASTVRNSVVGLVAELGEFLQETRWKPWSTNRTMSESNRSAAVEELVDVGHFLANLLVALRVTDEEWQNAYQAKQEKNRQRQAEGYDGVSGKCPKCHRSYDGAGVDCRPVLKWWNTNEARWETNVAICVDQAI